MDDKIAIRRRVVMSVGVIALVLVIDQIIKSPSRHTWVGERISVTDWFQIFFTENKGMAFGLDFFGTFFLALFRLVAVVGFSYLLAKLIKKKSTVWLGGLLGLLDSRCCRQHHRQLLLWPDIF